MRSLIIIMGVIALALPGCAPAPEPESEPTAEPAFDQAAEEAALRKANEDRTAVYNARDAAAYVAFFDTNCTADWSGDPCVAEIRETGEFPEQSENARAELLEEGRVVFVTPEVAILRDIWEASGGLDEDGKPLEPRENQRASIYVKRGGKWLLATRFGRLIEE